MGGLHDALKTATSPIHARVERAFPAPHAASSRGEYRAYLARLYGIIKPLERALDNVPGLPVALDERRKTRLLEHDLLALSPSTPLESYALCADLPAFSPEARALGCLYVVEGSTLGGQFIMKSLGERFRGARRFLEAYGDETGAMWKRFLAILESADAAHEPAIISGAVDTFGAFERWLTERTTA